MAVASGLLVDGAFKVEEVDDTAGSKVIAGDDFWSAVNNNGGLERFSDTDGVGETHKNFGSRARAEIVDGDTASHVSGGAVDFGRVFARETAAADRDTGTVVVDDEFSAGEPGVGLEATLRPVAGGIKVERGGRIEVVLSDKLFDEFF